MTALVKTYIVVKPPPTNSKNPLNLQIQLLVKPEARIRDRSSSAVSSTLDSDHIPTDHTIPSPSRPMLDLPGRSPLPPTPPPEEAVIISTESPEVMGRTDLRRSSSLRSSASAQSTSTSTASSLGGGQKKRVEPMFNLTVHNLMQPTIVSDAATDAKVAKVRLHL